MNFKLILLVLIMLIIKRNFIQSDYIGRPNKLTFRPLCYKCKLRTAQGVLNPKLIHLDSDTDTDDLLLCKECCVRHKIRKIPVEIRKVRNYDLEDEIGDHEIALRKKFVTKGGGPYHYPDSEDSENVIGDLVVRVCNRFIDKVRKAHQEKEIEKCKSHRKVKKTKVVHTF